MRGGILIMDGVFHHPDSSPGDPYEPDETFGPAGSIVVLLLVTAFATPFAQTDPQECAPAAARWQTADCLPDDRQRSEPPAPWPGRRGVSAMQGNGVCRPMPGQDGDTCPMAGGMQGMMSGDAAGCGA